jgi:putative two-component system response regulator
MLCGADEPPPPKSGDRAREASLTSPADAVPILVVDDDPSFRLAVSRAVASLPSRSHSVPTAADALRFLAQAPPFADAPRPTFIVLDFNLPDLNAPAVLAGLRTDPAVRAIPVLVLTQIPGAADERAALDAGAQAYHAKPSRAAALRELLLDFWRTHGGPHGDSDRR